MVNTPKIKAVPTNVITGFLGVGKTTAILHLLSNKPDGENWAILVNEFGEIGVDGSLYEGRYAQEQGFFIREVPGGCMCCAAGLPMQIALNQLLHRANPDRLLIEPTGLGHPLEVVQTLRAPHYQDVLSLQKVLTLVDARKLTDTRYTGHDTFNQQIAIADIVVGNKADLYQPQDRTALKAYLNKQNKAETRLLFVEQGKIDVAALAGTTSVEVHNHHHHSNESIPDVDEGPVPGGYIKASNEGEGYQSVGWRFAPDKIFDRNKLLSFLNGLDAERMKAVFITQAGIFAYNLTPDALTEWQLDDCMDSRIDIIARETSDSWEEQLMSCIATDV